MRSWLNYSIVVLLEQIWEISKEIKLQENIHYNNKTNKKKKNVTIKK